MEAPGVSGEEPTPSGPAAYRTEGMHEARKGTAMRLVYEGDEKAAFLAGAEEAEKAGNSVLAASLREIAEKGVNLANDWETDRVELYSQHGIDVRPGDDARVA